MILIWTVSPPIKKTLFFWCCSISRTSALRTLCLVCKDGLQDPATTSEGTVYAKTEILSLAPAGGTQRFQHFCCDFMMIFEEPQEKNRKDRQVGQLENMGKGLILKRSFAHICTILETRFYRFGGLYKRTRSCFCITLRPPRPTRDLKGKTIQITS
jgi:hypothetical protein